MTGISIESKTALIYQDLTESFPSHCHNMIWMQRKCSAFLWGGY